MHTYLTCAEDSISPAGLLQRTPTPSLPGRKPVLSRQRRLWCHLEKPRRQHVGGRAVMPPLQIRSNGSRAESSQPAAPHFTGRHWRFGSSYAASSQAVTAGIIAAQPFRAPAVLRPAVVSPTAAVIHFQPRGSLHFFLSATTQSSRGDRHGAKTARGVYTCHTHVLSRMIFPSPCQRH